MTGKPMKGEVTIKEVRLGLFRVVWDFTITIGKNMKYYQKFSLCGTQSGRKFQISIENGSCIHNVKLQYISHSEHSASQPEDDQSKLKLEKESVLLELKSLPLVEVLYFGKRETQSEYNPNKWEFVIPQTLTGSEPVVELWIVFGTNEVNEKIVINGLSEMFHNQTLCDVKFKFKNSEEIGAHVAILTAGSPVFAAMLQSNFIESKSRIVNIADIEMDVFKEMLTYLYTGKAPNLLEINFTRLVYEVADKYGVKSLKDDCQNLLVSQLSNNHAIELLVWAQFHSLPKLFEKAVQFIAKNSQELCSQPAWLDFMKDQPKLCLEINQRMAKLITKGYDNDFFSDEE